MSAPNSKPPQIAALACILVGLVAGIAGQPITGAVIAAAGMLPACYGMWTGMQAETQGALARAIVLFVLALGVAGVLVVAGLLGWLGA
jgi:hypothetical protein